MRAKEGEMKGITEECVGVCLATRVLCYIYTERQKEKQTRVIYFQQKHDFFYLKETTSEVVLRRKK